MFGYNTTGNGGRRAELYINKHLRGRTGRPVIFRLGLKEKDLALGGAGAFDPRFTGFLAGLGLLIVQERSS